MNEQKNYLQKLKLLSIVPFGITILALGLYYYFFTISTKDIYNNKILINTASKYYFELASLQKERIATLKLFKHEKDSYKESFFYSNSYENKFEKKDFQLLLDMRNNIFAQSEKNHVEYMKNYSYLINQYIINNFMKSFDVDSFQYHDIYLDLYRSFVEFAESVQIQNIHILEYLYGNKLINMNQIYMLKKHANHILVVLENKLPEDLKKDFLKEFKKQWHENMSKIEKNIEMQTETNIEEFKKYIEETFQFFDKANIILTKYLNQYELEREEKNTNSLYFFSLLGILFSFGSFYFGYRLRKNIINNVDSDIQTIKDQSEKIRKLYEQVDENVILSTTDLKGKITYVSEAFCKISGYSKEELMDKPHNIVRHPDMPKSAFFEMWEMIKNGNIWEGDVKNKTKNGQFYWVHAKVSQVLSEDGRLIGYMSVRQDITQQKRAEELNQQINNLLDNANEGFLSFGSDLVIRPGYSKESLRILGCDYLENKNIIEILFPEDNQNREIFDMGVSNLFLSEDEDINEMYLSLLPKENTLNDITFTINYKAIDNAYMVILEDVTEKKKLEAKIVYENKIQKMIVVIATRKQEFLELKLAFETFLKQIKNYIHDDKNVYENIVELNRVLHTFKGLFAQEEMVNTTEAIHGLESYLNEFSKQRDIDNDNLFEVLHNSSLANSFNKDIKFVEEILGKEFFDSNKLVSIDENSFRSFEDSIRTLNEQKRISSKEVSSLLKQFINLDQKSLKSMLDIYPKRIHNIAERLGKSIHPIEMIGSNEIMVQASTNGFIKSLVHLFRNMIDHGIEPKEERIRLGKDPIGTIGCEFDYADDYYIELSIFDDGRGIDSFIIKNRAIEKNIITVSEAEELSYTDIINLIFLERFSTKEQTDILSGRGIGLSVIKEEIQKIGGSIEIFTEVGLGTKFTFKIPRIIVVEDEIIDENKELSERFFIQVEEYIRDNVAVEITNLTMTEEITYDKYYSVVGLNGDKDLFFILSAQNDFVEELATVFIGNEVLVENEKDVILSSVMDETLNTIIGLARAWFQEKYKHFDLTPPLHLEQQVLRNFENANTTYSYEINTSVGKLSLGIICIDER